MPFLQEVIHQIEAGRGLKFLRTSLLVLALLMAVVGYNWRAFRNMSTQEAMDAAQLARNISEGKGYTTLFIRPLSVYLLKKNSQGRAVSGAGADRGQLKSGHPDLA